VAESSNLERQLEMTDSTWSELRASGVAQNDRLSLEFYFNCPDERQAAALAASLEPFVDEVKVLTSREGVFRRRERWSVAGFTKPISMSLPSLRSWVGEMVQLGAAHHCEFDGWGTEVPQS
jgi:hypothetical protein